MSEKTRFIILCALLGLSIGLLVYLQHSANDLSLF